MTRYSFWAGLIALWLLPVSAATSQAQTTLRGNWAATTSSKQVLHGTWSAQLQPGSPNMATGSWALLNPANQIVLEGTWSAAKSERSWNGTWAARIVPAGRSAAQRGSGRVVSGTFRADVKDSDTKTLEDMLRRTLEEQVAGTWRSGGLQGQWSLKGSR